MSPRIFRRFCYWAHAVADWNVYHERIAREDHWLYWNLGS